MKKNYCEHCKCECGIVHTCSNCGCKCCEKCRKEHKNICPNCGKELEATDFHNFNPSNFKKIH